MRYLLDTNTCVYIMNRKPPAVQRIFESIPPGEVGLSTITLSELWYGVEHSAQKKENTDILREFCTAFVIAQYDGHAAEHYGILREYLQTRGTTIGAMDFLIAAHAKALDVTLVTNNLQEFRRVPGLKLENWVKA